MKAIAVLCCRAESSKQGSSFAAEDMDHHCPLIADDTVHYIELCSICDWPSSNLPIILNLIPHHPYICG
ncbi:hypothetical protein TNCV_212521 [Trichonephila clavipes]|nr:hypothetical protein TNCV_212521 [Trichonephila clavipes]